MGSSKLKQVSSVKRDRRQCQTTDGLIAGSSRGKRIKTSPCQQDCVPGASTYANGQTKTEASPCQQGAEECSDPNLPEDIWHHIHSLMPLKDAARAACLSRSFLFSWRRHPNLILSRRSFGLDVDSCFEKTARVFRRRIDHILRNHSGTGVRKLNLWLVPVDKAKDYDYIDKWLHKAVAPGIEELTLILPMTNRRKYKFPCTVLSHGLGNSLRYLYLSSCSFHPIAGLYCLRSLTKLELLMVGVTGDELCCLLSSSPALEQVILRDCSKVKCLKIPCHLQCLSYLKVEGCSKLQVIESKAPNLSRFNFEGNLKVEVSLGEVLQVKKLDLNSTEAGCYTHAELVSSMPSREMFSPMVPCKLADLNYLTISIGNLPYISGFDCPPLFSILGASLSLDTFISQISTDLKQHVSICAGVVSPCHKSLVELACHVLRAWLS